MKTSCFLATLLIATGASTSAHAVIVFSDDFSTVGALVGSTPDTGGVWAQTGASVTNPINTAGGTVTLTNNGQDVNAPLAPAASNAAGGSVATSFSLIVTTPQSAGDYVVHLSETAGGTNFYNRVFVKSSTVAGFYQLGFASNSGTGAVTTYGSDLALNGTAITVMSTWNFVAGPLNDVFNLTVNGSPYITGYTWTGAAEPATAVGGVNLRQGAAASAPDVTIDNLTVDAIPEPASTLLGVLGFMGILRRRR